LFSQSPALMRYWAAKPMEHRLASSDRLMHTICHLHHTPACQLFKVIGLYRGQPPVLFAL